MLTIERTTIAAALLFMLTSAWSYAGNEDQPDPIDETSAGRVSSEEVLDVDAGVVPEAAVAVQATTMPEDDEWHFIVALISGWSTLPVRIP